MKITIASTDAAADALIYEMALWLRARGFDVEMPNIPARPANESPMFVKQGAGAPTEIMHAHLPTMSKALRENMEAARESVAFERVKEAV